MSDPKECNVETKSDVDQDETKVKFDISSEKMNAVVHQVIDSTKQQKGISLEYNIQSHDDKIITEQLNSPTFFDYGGQVLLHVGIPLNKISAMM